MGKKKGKYAGKRKIIGAELLVVLLLIPAVLLFAALKGSLLGRIFLSAVLLYFSYFWKKDNPILAKALLIITACLPWITVLGMSRRYLMLAETVLLYTSIGALLYWNIRYRCSQLSVFILAFFFLLSTMELCRRYIYAEPVEGMQHWLVYLICAIVAAGLVGFLAFYDIIYLKDDRTSEKVGLCILAAFLGFVLSWSTANNLNYMLDQSEPTAYELVILQKDTDSAPRGGISYYLVLDHFGEDLQMKVSSDQYHASDVGDTLPVMLYEGAFDKPYFIIE